MAEHVITFRPDGTFGAIYSDEIAQLLRALGRTKTVRASDVEPEGDGWSVRIRGWVHIATTGCLGVSCRRAKGWKLGTFASRQAGLEAEVEFLQAHLR